MAEKAGGVVRTVVEVRNGRDEQPAGQEAPVLNQPRTVWEGEVGDQDVRVVEVWGGAETVDDPLDEDDGSTIYRSLTVEVREEDATGADSWWPFVGYEDEDIIPLIDAILQYEGRWSRIHAGPRFRL